LQLEVTANLPKRHRQAKGGKGFAKRPIPHLTKPLGRRSRLEAPRLPALCSGDGTSFGMQEPWRGTREAGGGLDGKHERFGQRLVNERDEGYSRMRKLHSARRLLQEPSRQKPRRFNPPAAPDRRTRRPRSRAGGFTVSSRRKKRGKAAGRVYVRIPKFETGASRAARTQERSRSQLFCAEKQRQMKIRRGTSLRVLSELGENSPTRYGRRASSFGADFFLPSSFLTRGLAGSRCPEESQHRVLIAFIQ